MVKVLIAILIIGAILWIAGIFYMLTGRPKWLFHDVMEWHRPRDDERSACECYHCKYCGIEIVSDSQENWYHMEG